MNLKKSIEGYLKNQDLYHESDDILIQELVFNIELAQEAKADIKLNGLQVNVTRNPDRDPYYQKNRSVDIYQQCLKNVQALFKQLILSPSERQKLVNYDEDTQVKWIANPFMQFLITQMTNTWISQLKGNAVINPKVECTTLATNSTTTKAKLSNSDDEVVPDIFNDDDDVIGDGGGFGSLFGDDEEE